MGAPGMARSATGAVFPAVVVGNDLEVKVLYTPGKGALAERQGCPSQGGI